MRSTDTRIPDLSSDASPSLHADRMDTASHTNAAAFDFHAAFSRTIGFVTDAELMTLRAKRVAIAGLGGVGGSHLLTLTRLGIGQFHVADLDDFELANFNRQAGASMSTIGKAKVDVLARMAADINPTLRITRFPAGISADNIDAFLDGVDLYVDSLDFFAVKERRLVFEQCAKRRIPAITAAPLGMSTALLCFMPGKMTFEDYFQLEGHDEPEQLLRFMVGLAPAGLHRRSLVDLAAVDLANHKGPSTPMGCELCAGVVGATALKILLRRGKVLAAPHGLQFDAYSNRCTRTWRPGGNRNPINRLILSVARKAFLRKLNEGVKGRGEEGASEAAPHVASSPSPPLTPSPLREILDLARYAPSGDNAQPWRFEVVNDRHVVVHGHDTSDHCVYDLRGRASRMAHGALLETINIAASGFGYWARCTRRPDQDVFDVHLERDSAGRRDPLFAFITQRCTQRRAMSAKPLSEVERTALESAAGAFDLHWHASFGQRWDVAWMLFRSARIRLTIPEGYRTHRDAIEWNARYSLDRMPDQAVGLDPMTTRLMQWVMQSWDRVAFMNKYLAGTVAPRVQLDLIPGLRCGAHVVMLAPKPPVSADDDVAAGRAMQRMWLTATSLGLQLQPEMTPLIFRQYVRSGVKFTESAKALAAAERLADRVDTLLGREAADRAVFFARLGHGPTPAARSLRLPLFRLLHQP